MTSITAVVTSRNDDHGKDMLGRMAAFMLGLDEQAKRHDLQLELIVVEWNPPAGRPFLVEELPVPSKGSPLVVRYIRVPESTHRGFSNSDRIPLYQMTAKNVGIRRARGTMILCTNIDLLFSDELCSFLANEKMDCRCMYRANRCDVSVKVLEKKTLEERLSYCSTHIERRVGHPPWSRGKSRLRLCGLKELLQGRKEAHFPLSVDVNACGDFTLMSAQAWNDIKGYPELDLFSIYIDGLACHAAVAVGYHQQVLPPECCTYHVEHCSGWTSMDIEEKMLLNSERPSLDWALYQEAVAHMHRHNCPLSINTDDWGFSSMRFEEVERSA